MSINPLCIILKVDDFFLLKILRLIYYYVIKIKQIPVNFQ